MSDTLAQLECTDQRGVFCGTVGVGQDEQKGA